MALIPCPHCGAKISSRAAACPLCGYSFRGSVEVAPSLVSPGRPSRPRPEFPFPSAARRVRWFVAAVALVVVAAIAGYVLSSGPENAVSPEVDLGSSDLGLAPAVLDFCDMVHVEGGVFTMGGTAEQGVDADDDERPLRQVTLSDFYIGKYEVTQAQWMEVMDSNPSRFRGADLPVNNVSWNEIRIFLERLCVRTGVRYRLPTEAEWEYAARGGKSSRGYRYGGGNDIGATAWYRGNSGDRPHPVGTKAPNELGLHDMSGNVWEWCADRYGNYDPRMSVDPAGPESGRDRVLRGGSYNNLSKFCRVAFRGNHTPDYKGPNRGFRLAADFPY